MKPKIFKLLKNNFLFHFVHESLRYYCSFPQFIRIFIIYVLLVII